MRFKTALVCSVCLCMLGCSVSFSGNSLLMSPPAADASTCTTSTALPVADTVGAGIGTLATLFAVAPANMRVRNTATGQVTMTGDERLSAGIAGGLMLLAYGISATYGFHAANVCEDVQLDERRKSAPGRQTSTVQSRANALHTELDQMRGAAEPSGGVAETVPPPAQQGPAPSVLTQKISAYLTNLECPAGVTRGVCVAFANHLATHLRKVTNLRLSTQRDLQAVLAVERQKDLLGCDTSRCMSDIGGALGAGFVVRTTLSKLGSHYSVTVAMLDVTNAAVVAEISEVTALSDEGLLGAIEGVVNQVVVQLNQFMKQGGAVGTSPR